MSCNKANEYRSKYSDIVKDAPDIDDEDKMISWKIRIDFLTKEYKKHKKKCDMCKYFAKTEGSVTEEK